MILFKPVKICLQVECSRNASLVHVFFTLSFHTCSWTVSSTVNIPSLPCTVPSESLDLWGRGGGNPSRPISDTNSTKFFQNQLKVIVYALLLLLLNHFSRVQLCAIPIDGSPPGSPIPGILQARTLEWFAISFSNAWKWKVKVKSFSRVWLLATP